MFLIIAALCWRCVFSNSTPRTAIRPDIVLDSYATRDNYAANTTGRNEVRFHGNQTATAAAGNHHIAPTDGHLPPPPTYDQVMTDSHVNPASNHGNRLSPAAATSEENHHIATTGQTEGQWSAPPTYDLAATDHHVNPASNHDNRSSPAAAALHRRLTDADSFPILKILKSPQNPSSSRPS